MSTFSHDQKIALLVVPMLLFGVLGLSQGAHGASLSDGEYVQSARRGGGTGTREASTNPLLEAIEKKDYHAFVLALKNTPYSDYTERAVFDALVHSYELHTHGNSFDADDQFVRMLYG